MKKDFIDKESFLMELVWPAFYSFIFFRLDFTCNPVIHMSFYGHTANEKHLMKKQCSYHFI